MIDGQFVVKRWANWLLRQVACPTRLDRQRRRAGGGQLAHSAVRLGRADPGKKMKSPILEGEHTEIGEGSAQRESDGRHVFGVAHWQPLLQNASGTKTPPDDGIEIFGIEQTGFRCLYGGGGLIVITSYWSAVRSK